MGRKKYTAELYIQALTRFKAVDFSPGPISIISL